MGSQHKLADRNPFGVLETGELSQVKMLRINSALSSMMLLFMVMFIQSVRGISWTGFVPGLSPYQDPSELKLAEEDGTARLDLCS